MPHIVTENCTNCRFTDCVSVCPVACFHGDDQRVYIDPVACIDCGSCVSACPVHSIVEDIDLAPEQERWIDINAEQAALFPVIASKQAPLPSAEARRASLGL